MHNRITLNHFHSPLEKSYSDILKLQGSCEFLLLSFHINLIHSNSTPQIIGSLGELKSQDWVCTWKEFLGCRLAQSSHILDSHDISSRLAIVFKFTTTTASSSTHMHGRKLKTRNSMTMHSLSQLKNCQFNAVDFTCVQYCSLLAISKLYYCCIHFTTTNDLLRFSSSFSNRQHLLSLVSHDISHFFHSLFVLFTSHI